ncbi:hypothetical protein J6590_011563 [Homalodisca vitripennis]|nr:hypothetical protein J6590_011563 [Homalodisca vitripennis]
MRCVLYLVQSLLPHTCPRALAAKAPTAHTSPANLSLLPHTCPRALAAKAPTAHTSPANLV